jgi:hypothetical protein
MGVSKKGNYQDSHLFNRVTKSSFKRISIWLLIIQLLHYLRITTLASANNLIFKITLYLLLQLSIIASLSAMIYTQELGKSIFIRFINYHRELLT